MRRLVTILCLVLGLAVGSAVAAEPIEGMKDILNSDNGKCPKTLMKKDCLACHTIPTFALKEANPHAVYDYPKNMKFMFEDKKPVAAFYALNDIDSDYVGDALRYTCERGVKKIFLISILLAVLFFRHRRLWVCLTTTRSVE